MGVQDQVTPPDGRGDPGRHDHLDEEGQEGPGAGGSDWTWGTCRDQPSVSDAAHGLLRSTAHLLAAYLRPDGIPVTCSHESSTGGGIAVVMVEVLMSPMMLRPSRSAWYILSISSRC